LDIINGKDINDVESEFISTGKDAREEEFDDNLSEKVVRKEEPFKLHVCCNSKVHRLISPC
jgi:hypothetical protein